MCGERVEKDGGWEVDGCWWGVLLDCDEEKGGRLVNGGFSLSVAAEERLTVADVVIERHVFAALLEFAGVADHFGV